MKIRTVEPRSRRTHKNIVKHGQGLAPQTNIEARWNSRSSIVMKRATAYTLVILVDLFNTRAFPKAPLADRTGFEFLGTTCTLPRQSLRLRKGISVAPNSEALSSDVG